MAFRVHVLLLFPFPLSIVRLEECKEAKVPSNVACFLPHQLQAAIDNVLLLHVTSNSHTSLLIGQLHFPASRLFIGEFGPGRLSLAEPGQGGTPLVLPFRLPEFTQVQAEDFDFCWCIEGGGASRQAGNRAKA